MAIQTKGKSGEFSGKIGDIIGSKWKGVPVIKTPPAIRKSGYSRAQIEQQAKFIMLVRFLAPLTDLLNYTFKRDARGMTGYNKAMSVNKSVIVGKYPSYRIDYGKVLLSPDPGVPIDFKLMPSGTPGILKYSTGENEPIESNGKNKLLFIAAYCDSSGEWLHVTHPKMMRDGSFFFDIKPFIGQSVQFFAGFKTGGKRMPAACLGKADQY